MPMRDDALIHSLPATGRWVLKMGSEDTKLVASCDSCHI